MGGRISTMAEARFVGAPLRLRLGGRRLFAGAHGAAGRMHAGADGRDARGQEGADRLSDRHAGKRAKLEGAARRFEGAGPGCRAASSHWRWRARVLEGPRRGVPDDASSAMLAAQDIERARQAPEVDTTQRAQGSARDLAVAGRAACSSRSTTLARARIRQSRNACFSPFSRRNRTALAWDSPSADQSSKPMAGDCGQRRARPMEPMSASLNGGSAQILLEISNFRLDHNSEDCWRSRWKFP